MISFVRGTLFSVSENKIEVDTGSIGYEINVPTTVLDKLPPRGQEVLLYTYLNVREDEMSLFGFLTRDALDIFKLLITVSGIGPKGALGVLSAFTPSDLRFAILSQDAKMISKAPGIGAKTAQRLIMELKDKVSLDDGLAHFNDDETVLPSSSGSGADQEAKTEAVMALNALGYSGTEALKAVSKVDISGKTAEEIIKAALKVMNS